TCAATNCPPCPNCPSSSAARCCRAARSPAGSTSVHTSCRFSRSSTCRCRSAEGDRGVIVDRFSATPDLVARRLRIRWRVTPEPGETLADAPRQALRRKTRDFEFPDPPPAPDPYLVYDSAAFPPAPAPGITVTDLDPWEERDGDGRTVYEADSEAQDVDGRMLVRLRRLTAPADGGCGHALGRNVEIVDGGESPLSLAPRDARYYQLPSPVFDPDEARRHRAIATPAAPHGLNRVMYDLLPAVHRRF